MSDHGHLLRDIMARLGEIPEPCSISMQSPMTIVEMGLIDDVTISADGKVSVALCLTDTGCVHYMSMTRFIADALTPLDGVTGVEVRQVLDKLWTDDRVQRRAS
ncbi:MULTISPECIES: metal-sulfur cluster assembly factor [Sphingopyxis]|jgi:metal-sulfur cluster biosynthetic enzyme|uniref:Amidohydrolase 2 n=1 Tax=Sphingopyxis granuli TaxID=267128 RepID=A0AA86GUA5_9SPHN|nr:MULTISPECIES: iron-sulfur cluster assembly protein [Sphingopyxis]AMG75603.1 Amidohydrolase 2 [Sphingopyxis granuli]HEV7312516.1 iron-sulfur cluster assembly protein [Sphingopyxis sp.]